MFQIPDERNRQAVNLFFFFINSIKIKQGLRGMFVAAVPTVDDRHGRIFFGKINGGVLGMTQHDEIAEAADHADRILQ